MTLHRNSDTPHCHSKTVSLWHFIAIRTHLTVTESCSSCCVMYFPYGKMFLIQVWDPPVLRQVLSTRCKIQHYISMYEYGAISHFWQLYNKMSYRRVCASVCLSVSVFLTVAAILPRERQTKFWSYSTIFMHFSLQNTIKIRPRQGGESPCRIHSMPCLAGCRRQLGTKYWRNTAKWQHSNTLYKA